MKWSVFSRSSLLVAAVFTLWSGFAQTKTPIALVNVTGTIGSASILRPASLSGTGTAAPFGSAAVSFIGSQDETSGLTQGTFTFFLNRLDSFTVTASPQMVSKDTSLSLSGTIAGGTGVFSGATGSLTYTLTYIGITSSAGTFTLAGSGSVTAGKNTTAFTLAGFSGTASLSNAVGGALQATPTGSVTPFGNALVNFSGAFASSAAGAPIQGALTFVFNANDSFTAAFSFVYDFNNPSINLPCTITGGTGQFSGSSGSLAANLTTNNDGTFALTGSGTITQPHPNGPLISSIITANGDATIAQNDYIVIKGANMVPANTPVNGAIWSTAPSFASGMMPTQLGGVSVTVNNKPAFVYFYCSAATDPACAQDQLNILTPLDNTTGPVQVVVTSGGVSTVPFSANMQAVAPSLLLFSNEGYVVATHGNYTLVGPASLYPGSSSPAKPGETIALYAVGFGLPATALVNGSSSQSASLAVYPQCQVGGNPASLSFASLISPGLYQFNIAIPSAAANGDNTVVCAYNGSATPAGNLITVQR